MARSNIPIALAILLVVAGGLLHGNWTNRWGDAPELLHATQTLPKLPLTIGEWVGRDIEPTEDQKRAYEKAELRVAVVRSYTRTNERGEPERIDIMAVCGPTGAIGTHTPEACYHGAGYTMAKDPDTFAPPEGSPAATTGLGQPNQFMVTDFRRMGAASQSGLKIYWAYRPGAPGTSWSASSQPRGDFAAHRALYKIYVIRDMNMLVPSPVPDDVTPKFIEQLVPALEQTVFQAIDASKKPAAAAQ